MIYTITINPALDYYMSFKEKIASHQSTFDAEYMLGGKGINASALLNNLEVANIAICTAGGHNGRKFIELAKYKNINIINISNKNEMRLNVKSNFASKTVEQNFVGKKIDKNDLNNKLIKTLDIITSKDIVMIMGSLPLGYGIKDLELVIKFIVSKQAKLIFDISNYKLVSLLKYHPEVIKPNIKELKAIFKKKIITKDEIRTYAYKLIDKGAKRVIVSNDKKGGYYFDKDVSYVIKSPHLKEVNGSGAGDSMIAAFAYGMTKNYDLKEILALAGGAGSATATVKWIASKKEIMKYKKLTIIKEVK